MSEPKSDTFFWLQGLASQPGDVKVAFIWGAGGTGKSALANRLCSLLHRAPVFFEKYQRQVKSAFFEIFNFKPKFSCLSDLAKQMMSSWGWEELVDDRGVKYYGNPELKITQYQHPSLGIVGGLPQASLSSKYNTSVPLLRSELPKHSALALPFGWECLKDANGYTYGPLPFSAVIAAMEHLFYVLVLLPLSDFLEQLLRESSAQDNAVSASFSRHNFTEQESAPAHQQLFWSIFGSFQHVQLVNKCHCSQTITRLSWTR